MTNQESTGSVRSLQEIEAEALVRFAADFLRYADRTPEGLQAGYEHVLPMSDNAEVLVEVEQRRRKLMGELKGGMAA